VIVRGLNCVGMLSEAKGEEGAFGQRAHLSYEWKEQCNTTTENGHLVIASVASQILDMSIQYNFT
jgi:hypothetical protein